MVTGLNAKRAYLVFLLFCGLALATVSTLGFQTLRQLDGERRLEMALEGTHERQTQLQNVFSLLQDAETGVRGYLLTQDPVFLAPYRAAETRIDAEWSVLVDRFGRNVEQLERLDTLIEAKRGLLRQGAELRMPISAADQHLRALSGKKTMDEIRSEITLINQHEARMLEQLTASHARQAAHMRQNIIVLSSLFALLMLAAAATIWRYMRLQDSLLCDVAASNQQQQALFQGSHMPLLVLTEDGVVERLNPAAEAAVQWASDDVVGKDVRMLVDVDGSGDARILEQLRHRIAPLDEALDGEICVRRKDGTVFPAEVSVSPVKVDGGSNIVVAVKDVSERRRIDEMKAQFVSTVSHELRTPLTSIAGSLGLLAGGAAGPLPEKAGRLIGIAQANSQRLVRLINDILDIEKLEAGQMALQLEPVNLRDLGLRSIEAVSGMAAEHQVVIKLVGESSGSVMGDMDRLIQVVVNLLSNALKFSPPNETVTVRLGSDDGPMARLSVLDRGPGVPVSFRARMFEKFAQADSSHTRQHGGTGLGLPIAREIAERHGGRLWFEPVAGGGSSFHLQLPRLAAVSSDVNIDGPELLVVEDDPDVAEVLRNILEMDGYHVSIATTAQEALVLAGQTHFAAALIDLQLPDASGGSLIRALRESTSTRDLPILVVSADFSQELAQAASLEVLNWLQKPLEVERLLDAVQAATARGQGSPLVLHVEDDVDVRALTAEALKDVATVVAAGSIAEARRILETRRPDLVILDLELPDGSGLELLADLYSDESPSIPAIIYSGTDADIRSVPGIEAILIKSRTPLSSLARTVRRLTRKDPE